MGCTPLVLAAPAAAETHDKHLAVDCPPPFSQTCAPRQGMSVDTSNDAGDLDVVWFTADPNPPACAPGQVTLYADGSPIGSPEVVQPGGRTRDNEVHLSPGPHLFEAQMDGVQGGCNTGAMSGWSGTIHVKTGAGTPNPQSPGAQQNTMVWTGTGHGTTYNIVIDDDKKVQTFSSVDLPYTHSEVLTVKPGDLYQIVVSGKGDAAVGCEIRFNGQVVASQPVNNSSAQCIWNVPPN